MTKDINEIIDIFDKAIESLSVPKEFLSEVLNFGSTIMEWQIKDSELEARLIKSQDIYKEPTNMKCDTCKFNTRGGFPFPCPPCYVVDWENSSAEEYDFNKCLFYQEDKFEVFVQKLEKELDPNKEV